MKKFFCFLSAYILTLIIFISNCTVMTFAEEDDINVPPNILYLGDSIATGYGLDGYDVTKENCKSYANILYDKYSKELEGKADCSRVNYAIDGQTSGGLLKKLNSGIYDDALKEADAIVVSIGGNDLLSVLKEFITNDLNLNMKKRPTKAEIANIIDSITSLSSRIDNNLEAYDSNISEIAKYIKSKSNGVLIIQTLYNPFEKIEQKQTNDFIRKKIKALNSSIETHKNDENAEYMVADVYSDFYGKADEFTRINNMDIHPTEQGHDAIAKCIDKTIRLENYSFQKNTKQVPAQSNALTEAAGKKYIIFAIAAVILFIAVVAILLFLKSHNNDKANRNSE